MQGQQIIVPILEQPHKWSLVLINRKESCEIFFVSSQYRSAEDQPDMYQCMPVVNVSRFLIILYNLHKLPIPRSIPVALEVDCPQGCNDEDSGVFACIFADLFMHHLPFGSSEIGCLLTDENIRSYRYRMALSLFKRAFL